MTGSRTSYWFPIVPTWFPLLYFMSGSRLSIVKTSCWLISHLEILVERIFVVEIVVMVGSGSRGVVE
jgi:hypothetical protein